MSIEEEPKIVNNSEKDENIYNNIKNKKEENKINLNNIKPNILSPPDTPQISNNNNESGINSNNSNNTETIINNNENINEESDKNSSVKLTENSNDNKEKMINNENEIKEIDNDENNVNINKESNNNQNVEENKNTINNDENKKDLPINNKQNNTLLKDECKSLNIDNINSENNKVRVKVDISNQKQLNEPKKIEKMPRSEINISTNITRSLQLHSRSFPFLKPVDPVLLNIPDYFTVIKHPMDLSTIMKKIKENKYKGINEYISDVELMFNNCFIYNPPSNPVHAAGKALRDYFIEQLRRLSPEVQASLDILKKESEGGNNNNGDKRPRRQIKAVHHLEPEFHIPKKMKVIHKQTTDDEKEIKSQTQNLLSKTSENKNNNNIHIKPEISKKLNNISSAQNETQEKIKNNNKTTIKKLIAKTGKSQQNVKNLLKEEKENNEIEEQENDDEIYETEEEDEIEEEEDDDGDEVEEDEEDYNEEDEDIDEDEDDDEDDDDLSHKTKSIIRASQKVLSRVKSKNAHSNNTKVRNISSQIGGISKKSKKSKLIKSISKAPSLLPLPMDQLYQDNSVNNIVEIQINTLTMCLQKVTKQLELLQVQSKARKLNRQAKRLAKSLNMDNYGFQSDSDHVNDLLSQTALLTNDANNLLRRKIKTKSKMNNKPTKVNRIKSQNRRNEINNNEDDEENEYDLKYINNINESILPKTKGKNSTTKVKSAKKETKRQRQTKIPRKRIPKGSHENSYDIKKVCEYCGDTDTPMWRRGPNGKGTLCNKCGVKWKGGKIYQGEEIPMLASKNSKSNNSTKVIPPPPKRERKTKNKTKEKDKKKEINNISNKGNKNKQQKVTEITYNQKKELSEMINYLSEEKISGVVDIIKSSIPEIKDTQEEIELDIETINPATLYKLYNYVKKVSKPKNNKKNQAKNDDTSSGESSGESSAESEYDSSESDSEPNQILSRR